MGAETIHRGRPGIESKEPAARQPRQNVRAQVLLFDVGNQDDWRSAVRALTQVFAEIENAVAFNYFDAAAVDFDRSRTSPATVGIDPNDFFVGMLSPNFSKMFADFGRAWSQ